MLEKECFWKEATVGLQLGRRHLAHGKGKETEK